MSTVTVNVPSQVLTYANLAAFPVTGVVKTIYIAIDTDIAYYWDGSAYVSISGGSSTWGSIGGELSDQSDLFTYAWSAGAVSGFAFTNNGDGTANIALGVAWLRIAVSPFAQMNKYTLSALTNQAFTDNTTNYVYANYNAGTPIISVTTDINQINTLTTTLMYSVVRVGTSLYYQSTIGQNIDSNGKLRRRQLTIEKFAYGNGAIISATNRKPVLTAGNFFTGLTQLSTPAFDCNVADTFTYVYYNGVDYTRSTGQTDINNTQYVSGGTPTTMTNNRYRADFVYLLIDNPTQLWVVQGDAQYNSLSAAQSAALPTNLPPELVGLGQVVGRFIIEKNATTMNVASNFTAVFVSGTVTEHNNLAGLQGGTTSEYYHLTSAEHTVVQNTSNTNTGDETAARIGAIVNGASNYVTPLDADKIGIWDTFNSLFKAVTWANLKATLKTYFDTLYSGFDISGYRKTGTGTFERWYTQALNCSALGSLGYAANQIKYMPFVVSKTCTLDRLGVEVTIAGTAGSTVRIGIHRSVNNLPDALVVDAGTILGDSATFQSINISTVLVPGLYFFTVNQSATITFRTVPLASAPAVLGSPSTAGSVLATYYFRSLTLAPFANPATAPDTIGTAVPIATFFRLSA